MSQSLRPKLTVVGLTAALCLMLSAGPGFSADKPSRKAPPPLPMLGIGDMADAMNPMNPFNGGVEPVALPGDSRLVVFPYSADQIFRVLTAPLKVTTIEFGADEQIVGEPAWGENIRWSFETDGANHIYVKPSGSGLVNTLSVNTNKRSYEFTLVSSPLGGIFYQKVRFRVQQPFGAKAKARADQAQDEREAGAPMPDAVAVSPDKLNFDYGVSGSANFKPETVFDDGKAIWMRMPKTADWPVALVKDGSDYVVANFIRRGDFLVLQRLAEEVALRSGDTEVTVQRGRRRFLGVF
ncbi:TrbG/VirB9 family P-type conjugative transfer protein [Cupriavidus taiwanensis]|uniref:TrbG/VirB9 family P-type conjugative transfer protein n=1 Tax=Cupriavidus taiwanensis TaxID=164546 RepID=UPI0025407B21|nr:TrbG/VirB9 family P-type conjugative transfer protein [Cupriavidus taiwanensis]MDK3022946.1 TrbG/VirB9 family P-type conjugative transfer protein [Cupriavidus taiwanensis]